LRLARVLEVRNASLLVRSPLCSLPLLLPYTLPTHNAMRRRGRGLTHHLSMVVCVRVCVCGQAALCRAMSSRLAAPFVRPLLPIDPQDHDHDLAHTHTHNQPLNGCHGQPAHSQPPHAANHHTQPGQGHGHGHSNGSEASSPEIYWRQPPQRAAADAHADAGPPCDLLHVLERVRALRYAAAEPFLGTPVWRRP